MMTYHDIIEFDVACELTKNSFYKEDEAREKAMNTVSEYIDSQIKNACKNRKFTTNIKFNNIVDKYKIQAIVASVNWLEDYTFYDITEYKNETERRIDGNTNISFIISWKPLEKEDLSKSTRPAF